MESLGRLAPHPENGWSVDSKTATTLWELRSAEVTVIDVEQQGSHSLSQPRSYGRVTNIPNQWLSGKESTRQCKRLGFDPWSRKIPHAAEPKPMCQTVEPEL